MGQLSPHTQAAFSRVRDPEGQREKLEDMTEPWQPLRDR